MRCERSVQILGGASVSKGSRAVGSTSRTLASAESTWFLVMAIMVLAMTPGPAQAAVVADSRLSQITYAGFTGNGPVVVTSSDTRSETGVFTPSALTLDHTTSFDDEFWGAGFARTRVGEQTSFITNGVDGFRVDGSLFDNFIQTAPTRNSNLGTTPITSGSTTSVFEYTFTVTEPTAWTLSLLATRNPLASFAASIRDLNGGYVYLSPLGDPVVDNTGGVFLPGQYQFRAYVGAGIGNAGLNEVQTDAPTLTYALQVGTIPAPGGLLTLAGGLIAVRRRR